MKSPPFQKIYFLAIVIYVLAITDAIAEQPSTSDGTGYVVDLNNEMKVVHKHQFKDEVMLGSPASSGGAMYIRSDKSIWKITDTSGPAS